MSVARARNEKLTQRAASGADVVPQTQTCVAFSVSCNSRRSPRGGAGGARRPQRGPGPG